MRVCCLCRCSSCGFSCNARLILALIFSFICAAAALVKVTTSKRSISTASSPEMRPKIRSVKTAVFPLPAAAETRMFWWRASMTACCSSVNLILPHLPLPSPSSLLPLPPSQAEISSGSDALPTDLQKEGVPSPKNEPRHKQVADSN